jgi:hypothetical protein
MSNPLSGLLTLTLLLGLLLLGYGIIGGILAFQMRPVKGWGWALFDAAVNLLIGLMVMSHWPINSVWLVGTLFGISILFRGITRRAESDPSGSTAAPIPSEAEWQAKANLIRAVVKNIFTAVWVITGSLRGVYAQDLAPRAYVIAPIHSNAITLASSFSSGQILLNGVIPVPDSTGKTWSSSVTYYHSFNVLSRYANITAALPYEVGNFTGTVMTDETTVYRSGLAGIGLRFSTNLLGGPAMDRSEFLKWRQKSLLGTSILVIPPTGQYDPIRLINVGDNRWSFKPEVGYSRRIGNWLLDAYAGAWLFTANP